MHHLVGNAHIALMGELEQGDSCDQEVGRLDTEGGGLTENFQSGETSSEEKTEDTQEAGEEQPAAQSKRLVHLFA